MAWEQIRARQPSDAPVTIAWLQDSGHGQAWKLRVAIPGAAASRLGWKAKQRVDVFIDRATGRLRLQLTQDKGDSYGLTAANKSGSVIARIRMRSLEASGLPRKPSQSVKHVEEGRAVVITLPDWAAPEAAEYRRGVAAAEVAAHRARIRAA